MNLSYLLKCELNSYSHIYNIFIICDKDILKQSLIFSNVLHFIEEVRAYENLFDITRKYRNLEYNSLHTAKSSPNITNH